MKRVLCVLLILTVLSGSICACTLPEAPDVYPLRRVYLDGIETQGVTGQLAMTSENEGELTLDGNVCPFVISDGRSSINGVTAEVEWKDETITVLFVSEGLVYVFSKNDFAPEEKAEPIVQEFMVSGRLFFSNTDAEFSEYDGRSMALYGTRSTEGYTLFGEPYSDTVPIVRMDSDGNGLVMDYEVSASVKTFEGTAAMVNGEYDIADPFKFRPWEAPEGYYADQDAEQQILITSIWGTCRGAFDFEVRITDN